MSKKVMWYLFDAEGNIICRSTFEQIVRDAYAQLRPYKRLKCRIVRVVV